MKVLIFGAGVIGTLFAAKLFSDGNEVTLLARGKRLTTVREHGIIAQNTLTDETSYCRVNLVEELKREDEFDMILVAVPKTAVRGVLAVLSRNSKSPTVLFMVNTAEDYEDWASVIGRDRLLVGFPGAGGTITGPLLRYALTPPWLQQTTLGELDGSVSERLIDIVSAFRLAGIPSTYCRDMHAWQMTHAATILPLSSSVMMAGSVHLLPVRRDIRYLAIDAVREGFRVLEKVGIAITPARLNLLKWIPRPLLSCLLCALCKTEMFVTVTAHVWKAREELRWIAGEFRRKAEAAHIPTPALDRLTSYTGFRTKPTSTPVAA